MNVQPANLSATTPTGSATDLPLTIAFGDYDRTRPLIDGRVVPAGVAPSYVTAWIGHFCTRPVYEEYDIAEMSLSWYLAARCRGEPVIALPIFPLRMPVHSYMFCRADAPYQSPRDLVGKRVGTMGYRYTVNLWLRGILADIYGVTPDQFAWITREPEGAGYVPPAGLDITIRLGADLQQLLLDGELDAVFSPEILPGIQSGDPRLRRLFPDARAELASYVRQTNILPITHTVVLGEATARRHPWLAASLMQAFRDAQRVVDDAALEPKFYSFPDAITMIEESQRTFGASPYVHGLAPNRHIIETFVRYAHEQGYIDRRPAVEELFTAESLAL